MKYVIYIVLLLISHSVSAQSKETKKLYKKFVQLGNAYKQLPLQLTLSYAKRSNMPRFASDTISAEGVFYLQKGAAYIHFGNMEQIVTDSLGLTVMTNIRQMILSKNYSTVAAQLHKVMNLPIPDSSIENFAKNYVISERKISDQVAVIEIEHQKKVYETGLPFEKMLLQYNTQTNEPILIETTKRELVIKNGTSKVYPNLRIILSPEKVEYYMKEEITQYVFKQITHDANQVMPVLLKDRITATSSGKYAPVPAYIDYKLIFN